ncbi:hypothetical protein AOA80_11510 [Methanomassiliicoccales archaeon RumEn M1]|nr:hypothetical protein AOA80_11510 [Methanomassiliicoccales archaeon RumEn M1]
MFRKAIFPGSYIQGAGAIGELPALLERLGGKEMVLASPSVMEKVLPRCGLDLEAQGIRTLTFRRECCEEELVRVSRAISEHQAEVLVGMGGGKTIDTAKIAVERACAPDQSIHHEEGTITPDKVLDAMGQARRSSGTAHTAGRRCSRNAWTVS